MAPQTTGMIDILGPQISFMTEFSGNPQGYCAIKAIVPPGVMVPLHSHPERETFIILYGELDAFNGKEWRQLSDGEVFDVPGNTKHAFRNNSQSPVDLVVVTYESMGRFSKPWGGKWVALIQVRPVARELKSSWRRVSAPGIGLAPPRRTQK